MKDAFHLNFNQVQAANVITTAITFPGKLVNLK